MATNEQTTNEQTTNIELLLSREELLFVLDLLQAKFLPGLDDDPEGDLAGEQRALALRVACRALQARELIRPRRNGEFALHNSLLRAVGVCAYAQRTLFAYHWPSKSDTPVRTFFHVRGNDGVMHTRPEPYLHRFTLLPKAQILSRVAEVCQIKPYSTQSPMEILISNQTFLTVRQLVDGGDLQTAQQSLISGGAAPETAVLFASTLSSSPAVSILQIVNQSGSGVQKRDITIVQNGVRGWLVEPQGSEEEGQLRVRLLQTGIFQSAIGL